MFIDNEYLKIKRMPANNTADEEVQKTNRRKTHANPGQLGLQA